MKFENYITYQGVQCLNACILNSIKNFNKISELNASDICTIGDGFQLKYYYDNGPHFSTSTYNSSLAFLRVLDIDYENKTFQSINEAEEFLFQSVKYERPVSLKVNANCLEYHRVFRQVEETPHFINLIGILNRNNYMISDGFIPTIVPSSYTGEIKQNNVLSAWRCFEFECIQIIELMQKDICRNLKNLSFEKFRENAKKYFDIEYERGINIIRKIFYDLVFRLEAENNVNEELKKINYDLRVNGYFSVLYCMLEKAVDFKFNQKLVDFYIKNIEDWNLICLKLMKVAFKGEINDVKQLAQSVDILVEREIKVVSRYIK